MNPETIAKLEALLFLYGEPMRVAKIAKMLSVSEGEAQGAIEALRLELVRAERGLSLVEHDGAVQLATRPVFAPMLEQLVKEEFAENLTPASLEALTIIAYAGPLTRAEVDYVRGVNSSFIVRALLLRGLVERKEEKRGHSYLYGPSAALLKHLGVSRIEALPEYGKFHGLLAAMYTEANSKAQSANLEILQQ